MKGLSSKASALLVAATLAAGCGSGGAGNSQGVPGLAGTPAPGNGVTPPPGTPAPQGVVKALNAMSLPKGFEEPRGIALDGNGTVFVTARETATEKAVILTLGAAGSQVLARGDVLGTPNAMTNPVALAFANGTLYVADLSSTFVPETSGAVLTIDKAGAIKVLSAGSIDAPTGILVQKDGSLAVCGADPKDGQGAVFKVATDGTTTLIAKGGALTQPTGIGADASGTLFVSDAGKGLLHAQLVSVSTGGTPAAASEITDTCSVESGLALVGAQLFVAARHGNAGRLSAIAGSSEQIGFEGYPLVAPNGVASDGITLYVADQDANGAGQVLVLR